MYTFNLLPTSLFKIISWDSLTKSQSTYQYVAYSLTTIFYK